jgi:short-chain fatty acids transporter
MLTRLGAAADRWVRRYMPDPFVLVLILTALTYVAGVCALHLRGVPPPAGAPAAGLLRLPVRTAMVTASGFAFAGFSELLTFAMQMVLIVVTGEAIAASPPVARVIRRAARVPTTQGAALWMVATVALALGWFHWGFGLMTAATFAREVARSCRERGVRVHYPLLGTAAYMSMLLWHAGVSASAPLLINTPGHFLVRQIGIVPLSQTIFLRGNLVVCALLFLTVPWLVRAMAPRGEAVREAGDAALAAGEVAPASAQGSGAGTHDASDDGGARTPAMVLDGFRGWQLAVACVGAVFLVSYFRARSVLDLNHNVLNFAFVTLGLALYRTPVAYAQAIGRSLRGTGGIVLQFPFYGAIMALMRETALNHVIADRFVRVAGAHTLPFYTFLASLLTKLFVPSGGGEWAVEGPVMLEAAVRRGASVGLTTMGVAYGNMAGNMFQPFWALPLLGMLGLRARDIMGYSLVVFLFAAPVLGCALLLIA